MAIRRAPRPENGFYMLDREIAQDKRLTWGARGMLIHLLSMSDNWHVSVENLINQTKNTIKPSRRDAVRKLLAELEMVGYLSREMTHNKGGKFEGISYVVSELADKSPQTENPSTVKNQPQTENPFTVKNQPQTDLPATVQPATANPPLIKNKYKQELKDTKNTLVPSGDGTPAKGKKYPAEFDELWKIYPKREGANPKPKALQGWNARHLEGISHAVMLEGVKRYLGYCSAKGIIGTPYVMQAARFLGPGREFENSWEISPVNQGATNAGSAVSGESIAEQQLRAGREQYARERGFSSVATMGNDGRDLLKPLDCEEWKSTNGALGTSNRGNEF